VDATHVYFGVAGSEIDRVALDGGTVERLATGQEGPASLDVTTDKLFWVDTGTHAADFRDGSVHWAPKTGGDHVLATSYFPTALALDGPLLYWVEGDGERVVQISTDGAGEQTLDTSSSFKTSLAVTPSALIWTASSDLLDVIAMDRVTGTVTTISSEEYAATSIVVIGDDVFWVASHPLSDFGAIRVSRGGGPPMDLVSDEYYPESLVTDGDVLYWRSADGRIRRVAASGGTAETFVSGRDAYGGLAVDDQHVYWADFDRGAIMRAAK